MRLDELFGLFGQSKRDKKRKAAVMRVKTKARAKRDAARSDAETRDDARTLDQEVEKGNAIRAKNTPKPTRVLKDS